MVIWQQSNKIDRMEEAAGRQGHDRRRGGDTRGHMVTNGESGLSPPASPLESQHPYSGGEQYSVYYPTYKLTTGFVVSL